MVYINGANGSFILCISEKLQLYENKKNSNWKRAQGIRFPF